MKQNKEFQQFIEEAFKKATIQTAFFDDRHEDIARTWFEQGCITALEEFATKENIAKMPKLSLKWSDEMAIHPTAEYCSEDGRIKYIQDHWNDNKTNNYA